MRRAVLAVVIVFLGIARSSTCEADLIISEYVEGSSNNKAIELFNTGTETIDLSNAALKLYFNGNASAGSTLSMLGSLAPGGVHVIANSNWDTGLGGIINQMSAALQFNGDDAVELILDGNTIDVIGEIGFDPGTEWGSGQQSTRDNTLARNTDILVGDANGTDAYDPSSQWRGGAQNSHTLGTHDGTFAVAVPEPSAFFFGGLVCSVLGLNAARRRNRVV